MESQFKKRASGVQRTDQEEVGSCDDNGQRGFTGFGGEGLMSNTEKS